MERAEMHTVLVGKHEEKNHLQTLVVDERILKLISTKSNGEHAQTISGSGQRLVTGSCECGNEPSGSIKCRNLTSWDSNSFSGMTLLHGVGYLISTRQDWQVDYCKENDVITSSLRRRLLRHQNNFNLPGYEILRPCVCTSVLLSEMQNASHPQTLTQ
jgi:hypothetical protein